MLSHVSKLIILLAALGCALVIFSNPVSPLYLSVVGDDAIGTYTLEMDAFKATHQPPADYPFMSMLTEHYSAFYAPVVGWLTAYFQIPPRPAETVNITLASPRGDMQVQKICLHNRRYQQCWTGDELVRQFRFDSVFRLDNDNNLYISASQVTLSWHGDFNTALAPFLWADRAYQLQWIVLILLIAVACILLDLKWRQIIYALRHPAELSAPTVFLLLALPFGTALSLLTPLMQAPDEISHAFKIADAASYLNVGAEEETAAPQTRAAQLPVNAIITVFEPYVHYAEYGRLQSAAIRDYIANLPQDLKHTYEYCPPFGDHHQRYSYAPYYPAAVGFSLAMQLKRPWLEILHAARLSNFLTWVALAWLAIYLIPTGKWLLTLLALSPMSVFIAASLSPDALTIALSFLAVALSLRLTLAPSAQTWLAAVIILILLTLSKLPYLILAGLLLLPATQQPVFLRRHGGLILAGLAGICLLGGVAWYLLLHAGSGDFARVASTQLGFVVHHPLVYLQQVAHSFYVFGGDLLHQFVGVFGWLQIPLPWSFVILHGAMLTFFALTDAHYPTRLNRLSRFVLLTTFSLGLLAVATALYLLDTPSPDKTLITGLQGRYFIPLAPLLLLALGQPKLAMPQGCHARLSLIYLPFMLAATLFFVWQHYYG
jgi:hypothetical protein